MANQSNKERLAILRQVGTYNSIPDNINFGAILNFHRNPTLINVLFNTPLRFLLFPLAAIFSMIRAGVSGAILHFDRTINKQFKTLNLIQAIWDTFQSISITLAVIIGAIDFFAPISPFVGIGIAYTFTGLLAGGAFYQLGLAGYAFYQHDMEGVKNNLIVAGILASYCLSVVLCMVMAQLLLGSTLGILTAAFAVGFTAYGVYQNFEKDKPPHKKADESYLLEPEEPEPPIVKPKFTVQKILNKFGIHKTDQATPPKKAFKATTTNRNTARWAIAQKYRSQPNELQNDNPMRRRLLGS